MTIPTRDDALEALDKISSDYDLAGGWSPDPMPLLATLRSYIESRTGEVALLELDKALCNFINGVSDDFDPSLWVAETKRSFERLSKAYNAAHEAGIMPLFDDAPPVQPVALEGGRVKSVVERMKKFEGKHLAQVSGVSEATISRMINGISDVRVSVFFKVLAGLEGLEGALSIGDK